ncbi:histidine phosphatase family protein [Pseudomonas sp. SWRI103]|uniref:Histidine phosphatase family protein n=2 Tax=Pseudomonas TaxID=286 RepID=A0ABS6P3S2_9PSED|nr:histidine phosphatase family protein [Pseudomonas azadiae]NMF44005.1 histidine phosphatase family protein [Pseudomonas sp. SWRI 103]
MKHVRLIRHGESAANAGQATLDHSTIPLTPKGFEQAHLVALSFNHPPALIVASPFTRAHSTAMATAAVFSHIPFETWPIQEFTYLEPARCTSTTVADRREWVEAYWAKADPALTDGEGAESFLDFISRARSCLKRLAEHPAQDIVAYSHGQFINAVAWLIERKPLGIDGVAMVDWREYEIANHVPNCGECLLSKSPDDAGWRLSRSAPREPRMDSTWRAPGRAYQVVRDPERLLIEERAEALSAAGYPLPVDDPAMYAEQRLEEARAAARSSQVSSVSNSTAAELSAREVCQVLREVTFERRMMTKVSQASWDEIYAGYFVVSVEGWRISIYSDCDTLDYCEECVSPDGRRWSFDAGDRFGTDPIALLSTWEHQTLERLLKAL